MNQLSNNLLPFELACYEIYDNGYDPLNTIREFGSQYSISGFQETLWKLFENYRKSIALEDATYVNQVHKFLIKVYRVLMAYFLVHFRKIGIDAVAFTFAEPSEVIIADLEAKQRIHSFFYRIAE